ncbi:MacB family efflux pump subunit [Nitrospirillum viridazoti]|uniref:Pyoverdine export ATP-binding/permease protein PvdT n=1 Tax=Nitrospirillum viridazoti CBAmc TaxID=1441467 RepID=A0A248JPB0_9PROT|nr:MacB family efflux pump subunit [Nitrospirillum amazonense]ASG20562.1 macrolide ABC transporter permease/ATP-binding protein MacB [Nitrospirillum amazonense CBAmc]TWB34173.1 macrolide transport system ATP-binding/permease protein [Nitrospirillum amazonense]
MNDTRLELTRVTREYISGPNTIAALRDVSLTIEPGEMVAIVGASGSGKSTLLNILGCLDRPTAGSYRVAGQETGVLSSDDLARLRRERVGFVFQHYNLLSSLTAVDNVSMPAIYDGLPRRDRIRRAETLLGRLGLKDRADHRPHQLSGGQQQRVSIARALMNGGPVILADEPTGALDQNTGEQVLQALKELHAKGHTVIIVTHDMTVAQHADRIIEIRDGSIIADSGLRAIQDEGRQDSFRPRSSGWIGLWRHLEAARMAMASLNAHRLRTLLTMLGIIIGTAAVVTVAALGEGARLRVIANISTLGTNTLDIYPGAGWGDMRAGAVATLKASDVAALGRHDYIDSVTPMVTGKVTLRFGNLAANASISGVGSQYFRVHGVRLSSGTVFDDDAVSQLAPVIVIDSKVRDKFFGPGMDPLGQVILVGMVPCRIIGVADEDNLGAIRRGDLNVWAPYTVVSGRLTGSARLEGITVRPKAGYTTEVAEQAVTKLLALLHGRKDFYTYNVDLIRKSIEGANYTMTLLTSMIAVISLIVGGIGVMNITLVSVTERTQEIGVRLAVGARQSDILSQFLLEAVFVCLIGGVLGVLCAIGIGEVLAKVAPATAMVISPVTILIAFASSTSIGLIFGFVPARNAARLNPVDALGKS